MYTHLDGPDVEEPQQVGLDGIEAVVLTRGHNPLVQEASQPATLHTWAKVYIVDAQPHTFG